MLALVAAGVAARMGRLSLVASTNLVRALGYLSLSLVPPRTYPAAPPVVGSGDTIGERTGSYFTLVLISLVAVVAVAAARALAPRLGGSWSALVGGAGYVAVIAVTAVVMSTLNELGGFPTEVLGELRLGSLLTLTTMWVTLGVTLTAVLGPLTASHRQAAGPLVAQPA